MVGIIYFLLPANIIAVVCVVSFLLYRKHKENKLMTPNLYATYANWKTISATAKSPVSLICDAPLTKDVIFACTFVDGFIGKKRAGSNTKLEFNFEKRTVQTVVSTYGEKLKGKTTVDIILYVPQNIETVNHLIAHAWDESPFLRSRFESFVNQRNKKVEMQ